MEVLVSENGEPLFLVEVEDNPDTNDFLMRFKVYKVTEMVLDEVHKTELYMSGSIKFDGCSKFDFDGNLRLCGKHAYEAHKKAMDAIWGLASKKIKDFNP